MFARVTKYKMKTSSIDAAKAQVEQMKDQIMALPGLQQFINVIDDEGNGYVISIVTDKATSDANADKVKALWGQLADHLEAMPVPEGFDVNNNWS